MELIERVKTDVFRKDGKKNPLNILQTICFGMLRFKFRGSLSNAFQIYFLWEWISRQNNALTNKWLQRSRRRRRRAVIGTFP